MQMYLILTLSVLRLFFSFLPVVLFNFLDKKVVAIFPEVVTDLSELLSWDTFSGGDQSKSLLSHLRIIAIYNFVSVVLFK